MLFDVLVALAAFVSGSIASVAGFGIGSLLTPLFSLRMEFKLAVAVVSLPHFVATALRFLLLRRHVDRRVLLGFGIASAAGGLAGALLHGWVESPILTLLFGALLVFSGVAGLTGLADRMTFGGTGAWIAGTASGVLGGLVGNQGGIRSAALLGFDVPKQAFVATSTAVGLMVDVARLPVYLVQEHRPIFAAWPVLAAAGIGVTAGTILGAKILAWLPEKSFRRMVSSLILLLGLGMIATGAHALITR